MKTGRLISILIILLRRERVQAKELAEMFEVSVRTILRDVESLNLSGIPIVTYQGAKGGISIAEGYRLDKSILSNQEIAAIITTLRGVATTVPDIKHQILTEKLKNILSESQMEQINSKINQFIIDLSPWGGNKCIKEKVASIRDAIERFIMLEFTYINAQGCETHRKVEPYTLLLKGQNWYLYAWCCLRQDFRLFKVLRIKKLSITELPFKAKEICVDPMPWEGQWEKTLNTVEVEMVFNKEVENIVTEWFGEDVVRNKEGKIIVKSKMQEDEWLYGFILSFGTAVEVKGPPYIRAILAEISKNIYQKYTKAT